MQPQPQRQLTADWRRLLCCARRHHGSVRAPRGPVAPRRQAAKAGHQHGCQYRPLRLLQCAGRPGKRAPGGGDITPEAVLGCRTAPTCTDDSCKGRHPSTAPGFRASQQATSGTGCCCNRQAASCHARVWPRRCTADRHARGAGQKARNLPSILSSCRKAPNSCRASRG